MGDHGGGIQTGPDHGTHFVPGLKHFAAIDSFQDKPLENDLFKVDLKFVRKNAKQGNSGAVGSMFKNVGQAGRMAGHFKPDIKAFFHAEFPLHICQGFLRDVDGAGCSKLHGKFKAKGIGVGHNYVAGTGEPADCGSHAADGSGSGNENVLGDQIPGQGCVDRISKWVENGSQIFGDGRVQFVDIAVRKGKKLCEGPRTIDSYSFGIGAEVPPPSESVPASSTDEVPLSGDVVAGCEVGHP